MPYVPQGSRRDLSPWAPAFARTEGELNFQLTSLLVEYIEENGLSYERIGDVEGALQNASKEFARRVTAPYEDLKIQENGDVYEPVLELLSAAKRRTTQSGAPDARPSTEDQDDDDFNYGGGCCPCQSCGDGEG